MGPKNVGMMGYCLSIVLTIVDVLTAKIGFVKELCNSSIREVAHSRGQNSCAANLFPQGVTFNC